MRNNSKENSITKQKEQRQINVNTHSTSQFNQNQSFCTNRIKTAKYNM